MDAGIMKFLEEDEDEQMHSGEAVEAFTAALNRDIGGTPTAGSVSASAPVSESHGDNGELLRRELAGLNLSTAHWQQFTFQHHEENQRHQQQHEQPKEGHLQQGEQQKQQLHRQQQECMAADCSNLEEQLGQIQLQQPEKSQHQQMESSQLHQEQNQQQLQVQQQQLKPMQPQQLLQQQAHQPQQQQMQQAQQTQKLQLAQPQQLQQSQQQQLPLLQHQQQLPPLQQQQHPHQQQQSQQHPLQHQQLHHQPLLQPAMSQATSSTRRPNVASHSISFGSLMPMILPHISKEQSQRLQALYSKLRKSEVSKEDFLRATRSILGDKILVQAVRQMQLVEQQQAQPQSIQSTQQQHQQQQFQQHSLQHQQLHHQPPPQPAMSQATSSMRRPNVASYSISFGSLIPMILPHISKEQSQQLQALYIKLRRSEVSKEDFLRATRSILGDKMLVQAVRQMQLANTEAHDPIENNPNYVDNASNTTADDDDDDDLDVDEDGEEVDQGQRDDDDHDDIVGSGS